MASNEQSAARRRFQPVIGYANTATVSGQNHDGLALRGVVFDMDGTLCKNQRCPHPSMLNGDSFVAKASTMM